MNSIRKGLIEGLTPHPFPQLNTTVAVLHVYERAGGLKYGEVEVGQETVIFVGIRRDGAKDDIYTLAKKFFRLGLLGD